MPKNRGSFTPASGILFTRKRGLLLFSNYFFYFFLNFAQHQRGNSHLAHLRSNSQLRASDLARDVMQLHCTSSLHGQHHPAGFQPLLPDSEPHVQP